MKKIFALVIGLIFLVSVLSPNVSAQEENANRTTLADRFKVVTEMDYDQETKNLSITFANVMLLKELKYRIKYTADNKIQTIYGEIRPYTNNDIERNLRLGECSGTACTYDSEVKDIQIDYVAEYYFLGSENVRYVL